MSVFAYRCLHRLGPAYLSWNLSPCPTPVHNRDCILLSRRLRWFLLHGIYARRLRFPSCHQAGLECLAAWGLYSAIFVIIAAATEDLPFPPFLLFWLTSGTFLRDITVYLWLSSVTCSASTYTMLILSSWRWWRRLHTTLKKQYSQFCQIASAKTIPYQC